MEPTFREAKPGEAPTIRDFQIALANESEALCLDPAICLRGVEAVFQDRKKGEYWVLTLRGIIVGCVLLQLEWSDWRAKSVLWIHSLYILPEHRGKGLYRTLHESLRARVKTDENFGGLRLYVERSNKIAIGIYEKLGMTREHYSLFEWLKE